LLLQQLTQLLLTNQLPLRLLLLLQFTAAVKAAETAA
jgi:hypothetical protein